MARNQSGGLRSCHPLLGQAPACDLGRCYLQPRGTAIGTRRAMGRRKQPRSPAGSRRAPLAAARRWRTRRTRHRVTMTPLMPAPAIAPDSPEGQMSAARRSGCKPTRSLTVGGRCAGWCPRVAGDECCVPGFLVSAIMHLCLLAAGTESHGPPGEGGGNSEVDENVPNGPADHKPARSRRSTSGPKPAATSSGRGSAMKGSALSEFGRMRAALQDAN